MTEENFTPEAISALAIDALEDLKAQDLLCIDVTGLTGIFDAMIIATGTSERHVGAIAENVVLKTKAAGMEPLGVEGAGKSNWVLVDLGDVLVHVMTQQARDYYQLEKLWQVDDSSVDE